MLRTLIIDDEVHIRDTLASMLNDYCPRVKIVGEANSVASGITAIRNKIPDLILLDIKMDDGTGFDDCYTLIEPVNEEKIVVSKVLKEYDELLSNHGFFRVHRSHLVNLQHIKQFEKQEGGFMVMSNDQKIPVSSRARERLLELFERITGN